MARSENLATDSQVLDEVPDPDCTRILPGKKKIFAAAHKLRMSLSLQNGAPEPHFAVGAMTSDLCGLLGHGTVPATA